MPKRPTNRKLVRQAVALAQRLRAGPRPTGPEDPALDELAALLAQGLARKAFPEDLAREMRSAGLHVNPAAFAELLSRPALH